MRQLAFRTPEDTPKRLHIKLRLGRASLIPFAILLCLPTLVFADSWIYWTTDGDNAGTLERALLDGTEHEVLISNQGRLIDVEIDTDARRVYWTAISQSKIQRAKLDGSHVEDVIAPAGGVKGLALHPGQNKLYWTDNYGVRRCNLDGSGFETVVDFGSTYAQLEGIAVDVRGERIYWTSSYRKKIYRARLDGSNLEEIITNFVHEPHDLDLDAQRGRLYYTDGCTIRSATLSGGDIQDVGIGDEGQCAMWAVKVDARDSALYSGRREAPSIWRSRLDGSEPSLLSTTTAVVRGMALYSDTNPSRCSEWNGFFPPMANVMEHVNTGATEVHVETVLYDLDDQPQGRTQFCIPARGQFDLLVHELPGWQPNSYGKVCSTVLDAEPTALQGRMVYYRGASGRRQEDGRLFDFVIAMPFSAGRLGTQFVTWNTFDPQNPPRYWQVFVANWIHLRSLDDRLQTGQLTFVAEDGRELERFSLALPAGARRDFPAHAYGQTRVGHVSWVPDDPAARFHMRSQRYFYDNPTLEDTFNGAISVEGQNSSSEELIVPGYGYVELVNASPSTQVVSVEGGGFRMPHDISLSSYASHHFQNWGSSPGSVRGSDGVVAFLVDRYDGALPVEKAGLGPLRSSYNTFLNSSCPIYLVNGTSSDTTARVDVYDAGGNLQVEGWLTAIPEHGVAGVDPCEWIQQSGYGQVVVRPGQAGSLIGYMIRTAGGRHFHIPLE